MAAFDTPWITNMSPSTKMSENGSVNNLEDPNPATTAAFSPVQNNSSKRLRKTILVQQKSPLLIATPPQVTRALAFSHPFLLPLSKFLGLISWSSGDPWESFLLVSGFWAVVLFGDDIIRFAGPVIAVASLIAGMYSRRYSPLSTTAVTGEKVKGHKKEPSEGNIRHQKSLDEIIETMNAFTGRCNIMLEPLLELTDFLSTQQSATSATTRPALTTLFIRFLMFLPVWIALTLPPLRIVTTRRVVLVVGTLFLTWHSRPARISRTILWRSMTVRKLVSVITGLTFLDTPVMGAPNLPPRNMSQLHTASSIASSNKSTGDSVRFTFTVYENQRRWLGLGWTASMFAYERAPWTDEHLNPAPSKEEFQLPAVEGGNAVWRWVPGSEWRTEGALKSSSASTSSKIKSDGWIYYDNKWSDARRQDGWGRYTRRRKWYRDAELVEATDQNAQSSPSELPTNESSKSHLSPDRLQEALNPGKDGSDTASTTSKRRGFFRKNSSRNMKNNSISSKASRDSKTSDDEADRRSVTEQRDDGDGWMVGDDLRMGLG